MRRDDLCYSERCDDYAAFLEGKFRSDAPSGFEADDSLLPSALFPFQRAIVKWALRRGRAAIFADCGLGKTLQSLAWASEVVRVTDGRVRQIHLAGDLTGEKIGNMLFFDRRAVERFAKSYRRVGRRPRAS